ncbi:hypothetical protein YC2023_043784 [Brassica napus]
MKTHALLKNDEVRFLQVRSSKYLVVSFTKTLPLLLSRSSLILLNYVVSKISTYFDLNHTIDEHIVSIKCYYDEGVIQGLLQ